MIHFILFIGFFVGTSHARTSFSAEDIGEQLLRYQYTLDNATDLMQTCVITYNQFFIDRYNLSQLDFFERTARGNIDIKDAVLAWSSVNATCQRELDAFAALYNGIDLDVEIQPAVIERFDKALATQTDECKACIEKAGELLMEALDVGRDAYIMRYFAGRISHIRLLTTWRKFDKDCATCIQNFFNPVQETE